MTIYVGDSRILIPLPWDRPPLSQNDRDERKRGGARKIAAAKAEACAAVAAAKVRPVIEADVSLHYQIADHRRRDADNLAVVLKVCQDALVAEGVLHDDSWVCVPSATCRIHPPDGTKTSRMWLQLDVITEYDDEVEA